MASFLTDNDDLRFYLERGIDWDALVEVTEYGYRTPDGFKTPAEARRCLKRHLANVVYRALQADLATVQSADLSPAA